MTHAITVLLLALSCSTCGTPTDQAVSAPAVAIEYVVSGPGMASVTYQTMGGSTQQVASAQLPWSHRFFPERGAFVYASAQRSSDDKECVMVQIWRGESVLKSAESCGAFVIATASATY